MKKIKLISFIFILSLFIIPRNVGAISASLSCSSSGSMSLGNTITVTVKGSASSPAYWQGTLGYDSSKLQLVSGNVSPFTDNATAYPSFTYTFKSIATGSAYVKMSNMNVSDETGSSEISISSSSCNINITNPQSQSSSNSSGSSNSGSSNSSNKNKSSDNNLKSLSIENEKIKPDFNKDTLEYNIELSNDKKKIKINAEANDSKASIKGTGEKELVEGANKIEIVVTAENGSSKTYIINALLKEKDPIVVKLSGNEYTVVREEIKYPEGFSVKDVKVNGEEVKGYYNEGLKYTLVALKDSKGNADFYIYDLNKISFKKYISLKSNNINIVVIDLDDDAEIPSSISRLGASIFKNGMNYSENIFISGYSKTKFKFLDTEITGYALDENSDFRVIYAINVENGVKGFYLYDMKDKTIQRFYNDQVNLYVGLIDRIKIAFAIGALGLVLLTVIIIILLSKNVKFKKMYLDRKMNEFESPYENIQYHDIEEDEDLKEDKKEKKKKKKKEKTFLDD